ncbi:hypothetical protein [Methylocella sp.]|uniref:hypothetical protein n=1 Tax=Methylocella sp. TaxID=1978226 RepID=UPI0035B3CC20
MLPSPSPVAVLAASYHAGRGRKTLQLEQIAGGRRTILEESPRRVPQAVRELASEARTRLRLDKGEPPLDF